MAWHSSGTSNAGLVENLWTNGLLRSPAAKRAFLAVDRAHYAPASPYEDAPQPLGHGATISAPHMHAGAVEALLEYVLPPPPADPDRAAAQAKVAFAGDPASAPHGDAGRRVQGAPDRPRRVLDVGSGSGYLTHVLAELVGDGGVVVGLEHIAALRDLGAANVAKSPEGRALLDAGRCRFRVGDGRRGWTEPRPVADQPGVGGDADATVAREEKNEDGDDQDADADEGGWDAIHVGAAAVELHDDLVRQLRAPGRMFIPVGPADHQYIWTVDKDADGTVRKTKGYGVRYVPLTDAPKN